MDTKTTTKEKGNQFEQRAVSFLKRSGFEIIETNYYAKKIGEIDIIAKKDDVYRFVEVKSGETFEAVYNITTTKLSRLTRSVQYYLQSKKLDVDFCIDAIIFSKTDMEYLENITL